MCIVTCEKNIFLHCRKRVNWCVQKVRLKPHHSTQLNAKIPDKWQMTLVNVVWIERIDPKVCFKTKTREMGKNFTKMYFLRVASQLVRNITETKVLEIKKKTLFCDVYTFALFICSRFTRFFCSKDKNFGCCADGQERKFVPTPAFFGCFSHWRVGQHKSSPAPPPPRKNCNGGVSSVLCSFCFGRSFVMMETRHLNFGKGSERFLKLFFVNYFCVYFPLVISFSSL